MILSGKVAAAHYLEKIKDKITSLPFVPKLTAVQVGDNPASTTYINIKKKTLTKVGIDFEHIKLDENISPEDIADLIHKLNTDESVTAILLQLPLPEKFNSRALLDLISPNKDVDCLTSYNLGNFFVNNSNLLPATPRGVIRLLEYYNVEIKGKKICVVGRSALVGKPLAVALTDLDATVTICHSKTEDLKEQTLNADIIISAVGKAKFLTREYFKSGQTVIDVGTSKDKDGNLTGDVDFENVQEVVENITPVPGGVGPMTVYSIAENMTSLIS